MKKYNLVLPLNGIGSRFRNKGVETPKPMIMAGHKTILEWGLDSIETKDCNLIFIIRRDQPNFYNFIKYKWSESNIIVADRNTKGSLDTVSLASNFIKNETPLIVFNSDVFFEKYVPNISDFQDGTILTFKSNSPNYSYVRDVGGLAVETAEKKIISEYATVGLYCFKSGKLLLDKFEESVAVNDEHYIAPIYNQIINEGHKIKTKHINKLGVIGTPEELKFFNDHGYRTMIDKKFVLTCDHSGLDQIKVFEKALINLGIYYEMVGPSCSKDCDYKEYVDLACDKIINQGFVGIGSCRSGQGVSICANKNSNKIISCLISNKETYKDDVELGIRHNCANFFSFASKANFGVKNCEEILQSIQNTSFDYGRHQIRLQKTLGYI